MSIPTFVNFGTYNEITSSTNTPALPTGRVNGNLLIAWCHNIGSTILTLSVSAGWTIFTSVLNDGAHAHAMVLAYAYVTGSETAPTFTSTAVETLDASVLQYSGTLSSNPIGAIASNFNLGASTTITCPAIITTAANSLALNYQTLDSPGPSGWVAETAYGVGTFLASDMGEPTPRSTAGPTSVTASTSNYDVFTFELMSQLPAPGFGGGSTATIIRTRDGGFQW